MSLENTSLNEEVSEILNQGPLPVNYSWTAVFSTPNGFDTADGSLPALRVLSIDDRRDYVNNYSAEIILEVALGYGTYQHQIIPNASDITVVVQRHALKEGTSQPDISSDIEAQSWRAVLRRPSSAALEGGRLLDVSREAGDLMQVVQVQFQLVDLAIEQTRMQSVGGILQNTTALDAISYFMTKVAQGLNVDSNHQIKGFEKVPANNTTVYPQIVVPHGTRAVDVPGYIEAHWGAPYATGLGTFLQKGLWYIYPIFDLTRYDNAKRTLTVINVPKNRLPSADRTYRTTFRQVVILATLDVAHFDPGDLNQLNQGNGARYADADRIFDSFAEVKDNKALVYRTKNANEYQVASRPNGLNNIVTADQAITSNTYWQMSQLASRLGSFINVGWENSQMGLIEPGMPCRFMYAVDNEVFELKGVVIGSHDHTEPKEPGLIEGPHRTNTMLTLYVERKLDWRASQQATG